MHCRSWMAHLCKKLWGKHYGFKVIVGDRQTNRQTFLQTLRKFIYDFKTLRDIFRNRKSIHSHMTNQSQKCDNGHWTCLFVQYLQDDCQIRKIPYNWRTTHFASYRGSSSYSSTSSFPKWNYQSDST